MKYKMGVRWMQYMESESAGKHDANYLVLDIILTISMINDPPYGFHANHHLHPVMLIIIIIFQVLGQMWFQKKLHLENMRLNKSGELEYDVFLQSWNDVANNHLL